MIVKILNTELEIDFYDADVMEKIENSFEETQQEVQNYMNKKTQKTSEVIRSVCKVVFDFFNKVFGEGTDKKIFGTKTNLIECLKAFEQFVDAKVKQDKELEEISNKYNPNRAKRKAK